MLLKAIEIRMGADKTVTDPMYDLYFSEKSAEDGVRAILEPFEARELHEILPNYLQRAGVDVSWRTSNWGEPPVHTEKYYKIQDLREKYENAVSDACLMIRSYLPSLRGKRQWPALMDYDFESIPSAARE